MVKCLLRLWSLDSGLLNHVSRRHLLISRRDMFDLDRAVVLVYSSHVDRSMEIAAIIRLGHKESDQDKIKSGKDANQPVIPTPTLRLNEKATDNRGQATAKAEPGTLDAALRSSLVEKEDVVQGVDTERLACSSCQYDSVNNIVRVKGQSILRTSPRGEESCKEQRDVRFGGGRPDVAYKEYNSTEQPERTFA